MSWFMVPKQRPRLCFQNSVRVYGTKTTPEFMVPKQRPRNESGKQLYLHIGGKTDGGKQLYLHIGGKRAASNFIYT